MSSSGWRVNYALRPAKGIQRKLICEILRQLNKVVDIKNYRYIGFGAHYFADFILFHKELYINNLISIEKDKSNEDRFEFNKPYGFIDILYGVSSRVLEEQLTWDQKTKNIIWLDYDGNLDASKVNDFELCINKIASGSVLIISFNAEINNCNGRRLQAIRRSFNEDENKLPQNIKEKQLTPKYCHEVFHKIFDISIKKAIHEKNAKYLKDCEKFTYKQIMFFQYNDGVPMLTLGYYFMQKQDELMYEACEFSSVKGYSDKNSPKKIEMPNLTAKEIQEINKYMPNSDEIHEKLKFLPEKDITKYLNIYREYPHYRETSYIQ